MLKFLILILIVFVINKLFVSKTASNASINSSSNSNSSNMVQVIQSTEEFDSALSSAGADLVVVDFFATWCGPCKMIAPMLEKFATEYSTAKFYKVDVDQLPPIAQKYQIASMPTILFFKKGEVIASVIGANPAAIKHTIASNI